MNFNAINEHLIVGSHPRDATAIDDLYNHHGVRAIVNLQRSGEALRGEIEAITEQCALTGDRIWYQRVPIRDADESSLRYNLCEAVGILNRAIQEKLREPGEKVYLHCCEGLGRSASVAVAYLYWFTDITLDEACDLLREKRAHSTPYRDAIRGATCDILGRSNEPDKFLELPPEAFKNIETPEKGMIQGCVQKLSAVLNA